MLSHAECISSSCACSFVVQWAFFDKYVHQAALLWSSSHSVMSYDMQQLTVDHSAVHLSVCPSFLLAVGLATVDSAQYL